MALEPPPVRSINAAIDNLVEIGALRPPPSLGLTTLGYHLANLPLDARLGKMLIYGAVLQCVEQFDKWWTSCTTPFVAADFRKPQRPPSADRGRR